MSDNFPKDVASNDGARHSRRPDDAATGNNATSDTASGKENPAVVETLRDAAHDLLFPSETDAPLEPFFWPDAATETLTPERLTELAETPAEQKIKSVKLQTFFRPATQEEEWHNDEEKATVEKFRQLVATIQKTLKDVKVFRVGEVKIDVYIVGRVEGGWAGLKTHVVET